MAFETALPVLANGINTNVKLKFSEKGYNVNSF